MKVKYEFASETIEIEVTEEWGNMLVDLSRKEYNNNQTETRRHISLDGMDYEGELFTDDTDIEYLLIQNQNSETLHEAIWTLLPQQKELLRKVYFEGRTIVSIAQEEGVSKQSVHERLNRALKKLKKVLL